MNKWLRKLFGKTTTDRPESRLVVPDRTLDTAIHETPVASAPPFVALNELETLLIAASTDPAKRRKFQDVMLASDLLAATPEAHDGSGWRTLQASEFVSLLNVPAPDGVPVAAVFTSEQRIVDAFGAGTNFIQMNGATLLELVAESGAFLNPGSAYGVHWTADQLNAVLGKPVRITIQKDTQIMLGAPRERPEALLDALTRPLAAENRIDEAWLALAHWPEEDRWSWYLDVRTAMSADDVGAMLAEAFKLTDETGLAIDMRVTNENEAEGSGIRLVPASTH
ncbi:enhanced serine sensitivity protein SseB [compost metagenome]